MMRDVTDQVRSDGMTTEQQMAAAAYLVGHSLAETVAFAIVVIHDRPGGGRGMTIGSSLGTDRETTATLLVHAAQHMRDACLQCKPKRWWRR